MFASKKSQIKDTDLGSGSVGALLFRLAIPIIISQLVNLLYNMVDRIYIGHIPETGAAALTGLGLCLPVIMIITAFSLLAGSGGAPRAAISMGQGDEDMAERILGSCTTLILILSLCITVIVEVFARPMLISFGASESTLPYALSYLRIYAAGTVFVMCTLGLNTFITTQGAASVAMRTTLIGAVTNIILDPIFIFVFGMGVSGAALATIISQCISAIWVLRFLTGPKTKIRIRKETLRLDRSIVLPVLALGISPFIMLSTESILSVVFNSSLARYGGDIAVGSMTILSSVMQLQMLPVQGLSQGAQPIISFNYGKGAADRVTEAFKLLLCCSLIYTMLLWGVVQLFPAAVVRIFNSNSEELIRSASRALRIYMAASGVFGIQMAIQQTFVALSQAKLSLFIACLRKIILLIPLVYILPHFFADKVFAVFLAEPVADLISVTAAGSLFMLNYRRIMSASLLFCDGEERKKEDAG
ncbi:MAG: MATE family efflux transporter [Eubacteriales bacterium]|nr:MATE family efflux transporter [Eubacteriales bacterium]